MNKRFLHYLLVVAVLFATPAVYATVDGVISAQVQLNDRRNVGINAAANLSVNAAPSTSYTSGVGANQGNILYQATLTMTAGAYALNLTTATDSYGTALGTVRIKGIYIKNTATTSMTVGAGTTPVTTLLNSTGTLTLPAGAWFSAATPDATGWVVTPSTAMLINFAGTGTATFQVVILGGSS
ncbi:MAG TPA: hypothetical protein VKQ71_03530 [Acidimicrobiales bacterium]|nr:hypothetical protein [Acidimicrobiales bacterium]